MNDAEPNAEADRTRSRLASRLATRDLEISEMKDVSFDGSRPQSSLTTEVCEEAGCLAFEGDSWRGMMAPDVLTRWERGA